MPGAVLGSWATAMNSMVGDPWPAVCILVQRQMFTVASDEDRDGEEGVTGEVTTEWRSEGDKPGSPTGIKVVGRRNGNSLVRCSYIAFTWQKPVLVRPNSPPTTHPHLQKATPRHRAGWSH